jgi:hypothetical protein
VGGSLAVAGWLGIADVELLRRRIGLVRYGFKWPHNFIADTINREIHLRGRLEVFSHHVFEHGAAEAFP